MGICVFCPKYRFQNNFKVGFTLSESLIYEDEYIFVTPDLAPLVSGHLLIVSQKHYNSFSSAPIEVKKALKKAMEHIYKSLGCQDITWFEHGAVFPGKGGASIDHAHLHVLPCNLSVQKAVEYDNKYFQKEEFSIETFNSLANKQPYLWIGNGLDSSNIYFVNYLPSQYLRNIIMQLQGSNVYNWKNSFMEEESKEKYRETLKKILR
ncbi:MAG: HIT domain-containing protein [Oscillospiraceae bacterium]|nr:HIT domain-containing protein [Oscillospiraceae bacterium]